MPAALPGGTPPPGSRGCHSSIQLPQQQAAQLWQPVCELAEGQCGEVLQQASFGTQALKAGQVRQASKAGQLGVVAQGQRAQLRQLIKPLQAACRWGKGGGSNCVLNRGNSEIKCCTSFTC